MLDQINRFRKSKFVHNVAVVATGTAGAQAITMAFSPIITRLYGPESFGLLGTFMAVLTVATPVAALSYPIAIVLPQKDSEAIGLAKLSAGLATAIAILLTFILLFLGDWITDLVSLQNIGGFLILVPIAMLFSAFQQILQQWLIRKKLFRITARVAVFQSLILNTAKVGIGWFHPVGSILIILATAGNALHAILLCLNISKSHNALPNKKMERTEDVQLKDVAWQFRDFPVYRAPQALINALSHSLPVLMLASFFGPVVAGYYALSKTVMSVPITLISKSVGDVFYPSITEAHHRGENLYVLLLKTTISLFVIGFIPFGIVVVYGPFIFSFVFGPEWGEAGKYASWMAIWLFFGLLNRPSVVSLPIFNMLDMFLVYEVVSVILRAIAVYVGLSFYGSAYAAVILFSLTGALLNFSLIFFVLWKSKS
ncbi:oligosaccharide flippase family protein [Vreelandella aquamarina]|uniref:lipopolysaccharide biosynthesis protein n=1 Tax=Vreelandella aquamarina TaxID=77097 RepID=UPI00384FD6D8